MDLFLQFFWASGGCFSCENYEVHQGKMCFVNVGYTITK